MTVWPDVGDAASQTTADPSPPPTTRPAIDAPAPSTGPSEQVAGGVITPPPVEDQSALADNSPSPGSHPPLATRRILKVFDFDERAAGNYSRLPLNWRRHGGTGFPLYLEGEIDFSRGAGRPPSFRLNLNGGSLAYHYQGRDIAVRPGCDYLITCQVLTEGLIHARAYLSVSFLDRHGVPLAGTERVSERIGGPPSGPASEQREDGWRQLQLRIPCDHPDARYLGLTLWVSQPRIWDTSPRAIRHIEHEDIRAVAWFDDLIVYRMPRVSLTPARPGGVFPAGQPLEVVASVSDPDGLHLTAEVTLSSADRTLVESRPVRLQTRGHEEADRLSFGALPIGLYEAELVVRTGPTVLVRQGLSLACVGPRVGPPSSSGRGFGVCLTTPAGVALAAQQSLLSELRPQLVKLPVWAAQPALRGEPPDTAALDACLRAIRDVQADPVGVMADESGYDPDRENALPSMISLFHEDPLAWKHLVAGTWSRYAGLILIWQVGADDQTRLWTDPRLPGLLPRLRREMNGLMSDPTLAITGSAPLPPTVDRPQDFRSVLIPAEVSPADIAGFLADVPVTERPRLWATVQPLPAGPYPRVLRLADLARRLIEAKAAGVGTVFLPAPWRLESDESRTVVRPDEDYLVLRTVADVLGGSRPAGRMVLHGCVQGLIFERQGSRLLCIWDDQAPPEGRTHPLTLGDRLKQVDLWGRMQPVEQVGKVQLVRAGPIPVFLIEATGWLLDFHRSFAIRPEVVEPGFQDLELEVGFRNTHRLRIAGQVYLTLPAGWEIQPSRLEFTLAPDEELWRTCKVRFPLNAEARIMPLVGSFHIEAERTYQFTIPAWFELGLRGVQCRAIASRHEDRVVVRLVMTNTSDQTMNFESFLVAPERERMERLVPQFQPGQILVHAFVLPQAADLAGRRVRIGLRELSGTRIWNRIVQVP